MMKILQNLLDRNTCWNCLKTFSSDTIIVVNEKVGQMYCQKCAVLLNYALNDADLQEYRNLLTELYRQGFQDPLRFKRLQTLENAASSQQRLEANIHAGKS